MAPFGRRVFAACIAALAMAAALVLIAAPNSPATPDTFVMMPDGVEIAVGIRLPNGYVEGKKYPTIFEMSGYDGASAQGETLMGQHGPEGAPLREDSRQLTQRWENEYVTVHASVRGSGCSGGEFDLFGSQNALDGRYLIDEWIAKQDWSNKKIAIVGHSYSGITGFMVATAQPKHLRAISVSGLIDDLYRGIVYPGGVQNYGFPLLWTGAIRPFYDIGGGLLPGLVRAPDDGDDGGHPDDQDRQQRCATTAATKSRTVTDDPIVQGISPFDSEWYRARSAITEAHRINVPLHITGAYQDEQTGPRGPAHLWEAATGSPARRLLLLNGDHGSQNPGSTGPEVWGDRKAFIDRYLLSGGGAAPGRSVTVLWDYHRDDQGDLVSNGRTDAADWPLPQTTFTDWYFQPDGSLVPSTATTDATFPYVTGTGRQSWSYQAEDARPGVGSPLTTADEPPDQVRFASAPLSQPLAIHGPVTATLHISSTASDTDLFVQLADEAPDGSRTYLQRGMLKASHRAIDVNQSDFMNGRMYRPWRPHTLESQQLVTPGEVTEYLVEIFPVGHIFRPDHKIVVLVHAPPMVDSYYAYAPVRAPAGINTIHVGRVFASSIMLPVVSVPASRDLKLGCGTLEAVRCVAAP